jgi:hypothetical protein
MSKTLPSTPLPGTPRPHVPSPARTPSPMPLFTIGGPYTYTGQITRKHASRFSQIEKTRKNIKDAGEAWENEAQDRGTDFEGLIKSMEIPFVREDEPAREPEGTRPAETPNDCKREDKSDESGLKDEGIPIVRVFSAEDQFVDAVASMGDDGDDFLD